MQSWEYTPTYRGFDTFYGFYGGWQTYFSHQQYILDDAMHNQFYYDLRDNELENHDAIENLVYGPWWQRDKAMDVIRDVITENRANNVWKPFFMYLAFQASHTPNEAPIEYLERYDFDQKFPHRISVQAQTTTLDDAMNDFVTFLKNNDLWDNTLVVVT